MRLIVTDKYRDLSVCLSVKIASRAKTAEPIEMPFGIWTGIGAQGINVSDGGPDPLTGRGNFKRERVAHCEV